MTRHRAMYDGAVNRRRAAALALLLVGLALAGAPHTAAAQSGGAAIALIPFSAEKRLKLYGKPVAAEVTRALREAGLDVSLVSDGDPVPPRARLVVDGRLVKRNAGVVIEARIRDPERGVDVARPSASAASLGDIDRAAATVAGELVPAIRAGLAAQDAEAARARAALVTAVPAPSPGNPPDAAPRPPADRRPLALVLVTSPVIVDANGQPVSVAPLVAPAALELGARLGHRAAVEGIVGDIIFAPSTVSARGAHLVVGFELLDFVRGSQRDVPIARARARVTVFDAGGNRLYRRIVRTDTLVGSRGDRVDTLVRFAAAQVIDVVAPRIRERLAAAPAPQVGAR
jgi:hypothetical protein